MPEGHARHHPQSAGRTEVTDTKGNPDKQPPECKINEAPPRCPHCICTYEGWDEETYNCETCGEHYKLYYEDMK